MILLGLVGLVLAALLVSLFLKAKPETLANLVRGAVAAALGFAAVILFLRGQTGLAVASAAAIPMVLGRKALQAFGSQPTPGQTSSVETDWLSMRLDHDTGAADGEVKRGAHTGRRLAELALTELLSLLEQCRSGDNQSAALLEAYLDRVHPDWRDSANGGAQQGAAGNDGGASSPSFSGAMTREEAYAVLGLQPGAGDSEIREAHRNLMKKLHPDQGGSNYLAGKINAAKDLLLGS